jgi:hypothetical protein
MKPKPPPAPEVPPLAVEFFARFSRFEFALKETGFLRPTEAAQADWNEFAKLPEIVALYDNLAVDKAARYLIDHPPQKQVRHGQTLAWADEQRPISDMKLVCEMVRRVRNNLFHGGKKNDGNERDERLLRACIAVLDAMLLARHEVCQLFQGHY